MSLVLPSESSEHLKSLLGRRLVCVVRWLYQEDLDRVRFEQDADGATALCFGHGTNLLVQSDPERLGIGIQQVGKPILGSSYQRVDVSENSFWKPRIGQRLIGLAVYRSVYATEEYPSELGLELELANGLSIFLEYIDTADWPDTLRIRDRVAEEDVDIEQIWRENLEARPGS